MRSEYEIQWCSLVYGLLKALPVYLADRIDSRTLLLNECVLALMLPDCHLQLSVKLLDLLLLPFNLFNLIMV